jgi:hypothetical protein
MPAPDTRVGERRQDSISENRAPGGTANDATNAEHNAENQIHLTDPTTVNAYLDYLTTIIDTYH